MKFLNAILAISLAFSEANAAFVPSSARSGSLQRTTPALKGYLDDLSSELYKPDATPDVEADKREANELDQSQLDRFGPGNWEQFVDFHEFDGGDGQMGVAGDGEKGLDKSDFNTGELAKQMNKSRMRSARNAWGSSTGYAETLIKEKGMDSARAQQLENWHNQQEIRKKKEQQTYMTEQFDQIQHDAEADWRTLAKFGVERNDNFDLNEAFGEISIQGGDMEGTIELTARPGTMAGGVGFYELSLKNPFMGFADFRAAFTPESGRVFSVTPAEGSLTQREPTMFQVKFRPEAIGQYEGYLVIQTEDFKKVWKVIGSTA